MHSTGIAVRTSFYGRPIYNRGWYGRHPGAWYASGWAAGYAWRAATWNSVGGWFGYGPAEPVYYDYGTNITYEGDNVYVDGQDSGTTEQYYDQAQNLATTGAQADASTDADWLPLGVFALTKDGQSSSHMTFQLAVDKQGIIRGNYTNTLTSQTLPVHGSVDKKTQRAAWSMGDNNATVIETGLYNLTKAEAPALVHLGKDQTEQWLLVRLEEDKNATQGEKAGAGADN